METYKIKICQKTYTNLDILIKQLKKKETSKRLFKPKKKIQSLKDLYTYLVVYNIFIKHCFKRLFFYVVFLRLIKQRSVDGKLLNKLYFTKINRKNFIPFSFIF